MVVVMASPLRLHDCHVGSREPIGGRAIPGHTIEGWHSYEKGSVRHDCVGGRKSCSRSRWRRGGLPGGFAVGSDGAYYQNYLHTYFSGATDAFGSDDAWVTSLGGSYAIGPVSVGLRGMFSRWSVYGGGAHDDVYGASLTGAYALGSGINLEIQLAYSKYAANGQFAPGPVTIGNTSFIQPQSYDAVELDAGFAVTF
jgi:hypothetical protein